MIHHVQALSRVDAEKFVRGEHPLSRELTRRFDGRIAWVSIGEREPSPVEHSGKPCLVERFADVNPDQYGVMEFERQMTPEQAARIASFVARFAEHPQSWALMVHCRAGVSRSAAVAAWACERFGVMSNNEFDRLHPIIAPNGYVLRLLREAGGAFRVNDRMARYREAAK